MDDLLDYLAKCVGCQFISDLPRLFREDLPTQAVEDLDENKFTICSWNDALSYLTEEDVKCENQAEAKAYLLNILNK